MVKNIIHILALTFALPLLGSQVEQEPKNTRFDDNRSIGIGKSIRKVIGKTDDKQENEFLNNIYLGFGGKKMELCGNYVGGYRKSDILEARDEAKKIASGKAIIKEMIIDRSFSELALNREPGGGNIISANIIKQEHPWLPLIEQMDRLKEEYHTEKSYSHKAMLAYLDEMNGIFKALEEIIFGTRSINSNAFEFQYHDERWIIEFFEKALGPLIKFDRNDTPYGCYLSPGLGKLILKLISTNNKPIWLQKLLQIDLSECSSLQLSRKFKLDCHEKAILEGEAKRGNVGLNSVEGLLNYLLILHEDQKVLIRNMYIAQGYCLVSSDNGVPVGHAVALVEGFIKSKMQAEMYMCVNLINLIPMIQIIPESLLQSQEGQYQVWDFSNKISELPEMEGIDKSYIQKAVVFLNSFFLSGILSPDEISSMIQKIKSMPLLDAKLIMNQKYLASMHCDEFYKFFFRILYLVQNLAEFKDQLHLSIDYSDHLRFISDIREKHINHFINCAREIPEARFFVECIAPGLKTVPELEGFFGGK